MALAMVACFTAPQAARAEQVLVFLNDGRALLGEADPATSRDQLWIHRTAHGIVLRSGFAWHAVIAAEIGDVRLSPSELRQRLANATLAEPVLAGAAPAEMIEQVPLPAPPTGRVASLQVATTLANWDSDAAIDGLEVWFQPLGQQGQPLAIDGQIELLLHGQRGLQQLPWQTSVPPTEFPELARTFDRVCRADFGPRGAVVRLEFDRFHPESDLSLGPEGFLRARFGVSGQGVFEAVEPRVLLRPYGPFRDALQLQTGRRTFRPGK